MPLQLGDPKSLAITITNAAGDEADPTALTLTVEKPDGTVDGPYTWPTPAEITRDGAGLFSYTYVPADAGHYVARWVATGSNASAFEEPFDVIAAYASAGILSLAEVKAHLNKSGVAVDDDDELYDTIIEATDIAEQIVGPIVRRTVTETVTASTNGTVLLSYWPVISVDTVDTASYGQAIASYVTADLTLAPSGVLSVTDGTWLSGDATVTYDVGLAVIPPRYKRGLKILVKHLWQSQRGTASFRPSFAGGAEDDELVDLSGFLIPRAAAEAFGAPIPTVA